MDVFESKYIGVVDMNIHSILDINDIDSPISENIQGYNFGVVEVLVMINPKKEKRFLKYIPRP